MNVFFYYVSLLAIYDINCNVKIVFSFVYLFFLSQISGPTMFRTELSEKWFFFKFFLFNKDMIISSKMIVMIMNMYPIGEDSCFTRNFY